MGTAAFMPAEEYLRLTEKPTSEYREGVLYPKATPTKFHGALEFQLVAMLRRLRLDAVAEVTVRLSAAKYLVPDVIAAPVLQSPYPTELSCFAAKSCPPMIVSARCSPSAKNITPGEFLSAGWLTPSSAQLGNITPLRSPNA